jgi:ACR3 family arsenite efflux pump ArsB
MKEGLSEGNKTAMGVLAFLVLLFVDIDFQNNLLRGGFYLGIPVFTAYIFGVISSEWNINEKKDQMIFNVLTFVIIGLLILTFINISIHNREIIKACDGGDENACSTLENRDY